MKPPEVWKLLGSEYLFRRPWLTVRRDRVQLPSGVEHDEYYVLEYPAWVNVVATTADNRIVLVQQYRHGLGATHFELPAGVMDPADANPEAAARRELLEETGFGGGEWSPLLVASANPSTQNNLTHSFLAVGVAPMAAATPEKYEDLRVSTVTRAEARSLLAAGGIVQALHLAALLTFLMEPPRAAHTSTPSGGSR